MQRLWIALCTVACFMGPAIENPAAAQLTPDHRRELMTLSREMTKVAGHVRKKEFDEAAAVIDDVQKKVDEIATAANVETSDRAFATIMNAIGKQREILNRAKGGGKPDDKKVSFVADVAPLVNTKCLGCHGATNPRSGLRLDTFAGWKAGSRSGPLLIPGAAPRSLLMAKLAAPQDQGGMPQRGEMLSRQELETVAAWINQGANFDGGRDNLPLADLIFEHEKKTLDIKLPQAKGTETVKFTRDIAPWFANLCLNCHNSNRRSGGLSVETYFDIMKGGESGEVIYPGDMENSRLFRLVGGLELPRMPQGQARITRKNYEDLRQWFREGNTYDGSDPRTPIRTFVRSEADIAAERFASMTVEEMRKLRRDRSVDQLKRSVPNDPQQIVETENFLLIGNVNETRLNEVRGWADQQLTALHKVFGGSGQPWRGRLAIFVLKDRFSYDEFNEVVERRRADVQMTGHSKVTTNFEDAYVVVQDLGDGSESGPSLKSSVIEHLTGAYLQQTGARLPDWLVRGSGLYMAAQAIDSRKFLQDLRSDAASVAPTVPRPQDVFDDGTFSPALQGAVGYTLVDYLLNTGGNAKFAQLVKALQRGQSMDEAARAAYGADAATVARGYLTSLRK